MIRTIPGTFANRRVAFAYTADALEIVSIGSDEVSHTIGEIVIV